MVHRVTLSNGRVLLLEEDNNCLHIADEEEGSEGIAGAWICQISADGVLVYPNSGSSCEFVTAGLLPDGPVPA